MKIEIIGESSLRAFSLLLTCIKRLSALKATFVLLFERPIKTGFTVNANYGKLTLNVCMVYTCMYNL